MTATLYRPVKITRAEQAEALPEGTVAVFSQHGTPSTTAIKLAGPLPGWWLGDERVLPWEVRGWSALVPIEAAEHVDEEYGILSDHYSPPDVIPVMGPDSYTSEDRLYRRTIYTTPWEESR